MKFKQIVLNIFGLLRLYSLADLILLLVAINTGKTAFIGVIFLHFSFLFFLEKAHKHSYRAVIPRPFPNFWWITLGIIGVFFYRNFAVIGFILFSFLYTKKNSILGTLTPFFRGLQLYFLTTGIIGFSNPLSFLSFGLLTIRNFTGDLRDVTKDRKEKLKTLPIVMGFKKSIKNIHLIVLLLTTLIWWYLAHILIIWLIVIYLIQIFAYNLTKR